MRDIRACSSSSSGSWKISHFVSTARLTAPRLSALSPIRNLWSNHVRSPVLFASTLAFLPLTSFCFLNLSTFFHYRVVAFFHYTKRSIQIVLNHPLGSYRWQKLYVPLLPLRIRTTGWNKFHLLFFSLGSPHLSPTFLFPLPPVRVCRGVLLSGFLLLHMGFGATLLLPFFLNPYTFLSPPPASSTIHFSSFYFSLHTHTRVSLIPIICFVFFSFRCEIFFSEPIQITMFTLFHILPQYFSLIVVLC